MAFGVFNMSKVTAVWAGIPITGWAEGESLAWERNEDIAALTVGATGDATLAVSNNRSGRVTFRLLQSSATNDALSAKALLFETDPALGIGSLQVKDLGGTTVLFAQNAWLTRQASGAMGQEASQREWVLETDYLQVTVGGN